MSAFLTLRGIRHFYDGRQVLDIEELEVREGEVLAVVGPNGSGKSTLLRVINMLEKPSGGEMTFWDGRRSSALGGGERRELMLQMAMIFQEALIFKRSVRANLSYGLRRRKLGREEKQARVEEMLAKLSLTEFADRDAMTLSGGEAQKVALGRAMVLRPRLLLMDEPLASLDVPSRKDLRGYIAGLVREMGVTAIYVSHDYHEVLEIADRLGVLIGGRLQQVGKPSEVFGRPASGAVADFLGAENLLEGEVTACRGGMAAVRVAGLDLEGLCEQPPGSRVKVLIHPEEVILLKGGGDAGSARNRLPARVKEVHVMGALVKVALDCGFPLVAYITRSSREEMGIEPGLALTAAIKATSIHLMPFVGMA